LILVKLGKEIRVDFKLPPTHSRLVKSLEVFIAESEGSKYFEPPRSIILSEKYLHFIPGPCF
jgi:hypothetical protein